MDESKIEPLLISINSIDTELFAIRKPENESVSHFKFGLRLQAVNANESILSIKVHVAIPDPTEQDSYFASAVVEFGFLIEGIERLLQGEVYRIPRDLVEVLVGTAYNTTRGIMIARGAGTFVQTIILPIMDSAILVDEHTKIEGANVLIGTQPEDS